MYSGEANPGSSAVANYVDTHMSSTLGKAQNVKA